jgi:ribonuclease Z
MKTADEGKSGGLTRRDLLKGSGLALGGLAMGGFLGASGPGVARAADDPTDPTQRYSYFQNLQPFAPNTPLEDDELRVTFMGSGFPPPRNAQAEMSVFVEVGPWVVPDPVNNPGFGRATDSFIFDCGAGATTNYNAMRINASRMDKIFLNHLHGDHMSDLGHIYWIGPSQDRKSPQYVWGPSSSGITCPAWGDTPPREYNDGTRAMCRGLRDALRWATESFSFQTTSYVGYDTPTREGWRYPDHRGPVSDDPPTDGYALIPIELDWTKWGKRKGDNVAYHNPTTGVKITHFPVIHTRKGAIGYKLEWNGLSMVYTSDTKPEYHSINQGNGADVFIHEMILPADVLTMKTLGITDPSQVPEQVWAMALDSTETVQNSSHTPAGAYGYLLSQMKTPPRLAVATHFTVADDTVEVAMGCVQGHVPGIKCDPSGEILDGGRHPSHGTGNITWSTDLMVLRVLPDKILIQKGVVGDYTYQPYPGAQWPGQNPPKYDDHDPSTPYGDAYAQIDLKTQVPAVNRITGQENYRTDGY